MFYVFYISSVGINSFSVLKEFIIKTIPNADLNIPQIPHTSQVVKNNEETFEIWCDYFSLSLKNGGQHVNFRSEDYGMNFEYQLWFDVYTVAPNWLEEMLAFIGKIMKVYSGDCVLEANGDTAIVMRKNRIVVVDDKKLNGTQRFPFGGLGVEYHEGDLPQV